MYVNFIEIVYDFMEFDLSSIIINLSIWLSIVIHIDILSSDRVYDQLTGITMQYWKHYYHWGIQYFVVL